MASIPGPIPCSVCKTERARLHSKGKNAYYCSHSCLDRDNVKRRAEDALRGALGSAALAIPAVLEVMTRKYHEEKMTPERMVLELQRDPLYSSRRDEVVARLTPVNLGLLFQRYYRRAAPPVPTVSSSSIQPRARAYRLEFQSLQAILRCLAFTKVSSGADEEQEGDFLALRPLDDDDVKREFGHTPEFVHWGLQKHIRTFVTVAHSVPLSKMSSQLKDLVITHVSGVCDLTEAS